MPTRLNRSVPELRAKEAREREQARLRQAHKRARDRDRHGDGAGVTVTPPPENGSLPVPPTPPGTSFLLRRKERAARTTLRAFRDRGYVDDPQFWALVAERYPGLDLELEAMKVSDWLREPRNAKRKCSRSFLDAWLKRAAARPPAVPAAPLVTTDGTIVANGYQFPASRQRNPNPEAALPLWDDDQARRSDAARERVKDLLPARLKGRWRR
jgi:hypothetical protein